MSKNNNLTKVSSLIRIFHSSYLLSSVQVKILVTQSYKTVVIGSRLMYNYITDEFIILLYWIISKNLHL